MRRRKNVWFAPLRDNPAPRNEPPPSGVGSSALAAYLEDVGAFTGFDIFAVARRVSRPYPFHELRFSLFWIFRTIHVYSDGTSGNVIGGNGADAGRAYPYFGLLEPSAIGNGIACGIDQRVSDDATYCAYVENLMGGALQSYTAGSGKVVKRFTFPASKLTGRTDLRTLAVGHNGGGNTLSDGNNAYAHQIRFQSDAAFTKAATVQWDIDLTLTWARA